MMKELAGILTVGFSPTKDAQLTKPKEHYTTILNLILVDDMASNK